MDPPTGTTDGRNSDRPTRTQTASISRNTDLRLPTCLFHSPLVLPLFFALRLSLPSPNEPCDERAFPSDDHIRSSNQQRPREQQRTSVYDLPHGNNDGGVEPPLNDQPRHETSAQRSTNPFPGPRMTTTENSPPATEKVIDFQRIFTAFEDSETVLRYNVLLIWIHGNIVHSEVEVRSVWMCGEVRWCRLCNVGLPRRSSDFPLPSPSFFSFGGSNIFLYHGRT